MDHTIRIVAFSVDFRLRTINAPLNLGCKNTGESKPEAANFPVWIRFYGCGHEMP